MDAFLDFVREWGYLAVFLGSLVEGESIILTSSALASQGYLNIYKVTAIAFIGTLFADQLLYMMGRYYGMSFFDRFPKLKPASDRAFRLLHRFDTGFILSFRFIYGIRIASSIVVGAAGIPPHRFIPLNIIAAAIWAIVSCTGGYLLGDAMMGILENMHKFQKYIFFILLGIVIGGGGLFYFFKRRCSGSNG